MTDSEFIQMIKDAVKKSSITKLADELSVSQPTIFRWVNGVNLPYLSIRIVISRHLNGGEK